MFSLHFYFALFLLQVLLQEFVTIFGQTSFFTLQELAIFTWNVAHIDSPLLNQWETLFNYHLYLENNGAAPILNNPWQFVWVLMIVAVHLFSILVNQFKTLESVMHQKYLTFTKGECMMLCDPVLGFHLHATEWLYWQSCIQSTKPQTW